MNSLGRESKKQTVVEVENTNEGKYKIKSSSFVIQKYLEKPLLINNYKFDIRVWVLIDRNGKVYLYKEGYMRLSSE